MNKELEMDVDFSRLNAEGKQAEILLNETYPFIIGDKEYQIGALVPYTSWKISLAINKIQKAEATIDGMLGALGANIPLLAEVIALAVLNDPDKFGAELDELKMALLRSKDYRNWFDIVRIIFEKLDFGFFFLITRQIEQLSTMTKKMTKEQQKLLAPQLSLG